MPYITNLELERRVGQGAYVQLADDNGDSIADVAVVDEIRMAAEGEVNSYLARRYRVPIDLADHPELLGLLASLVLDVAEFRLRLRRPPVAEDVRRRYERTLEWLDHLARGAVHLPSVAEVSTNPAAGPAAKLTGENRLLTRVEMSGH